MKSKDYHVPFEGIGFDYMCSNWLIEYNIRPIHTKFQNKWNSKRILKNQNKDYTETLENSFHFRMQIFYS